ncbi:hypothetical protein [Spiroplasma endosymbiont of Nebria brevicollis]|uniref:hypothetical protein n=1 Tax=Spiroplasma endosymbiont of Nebria brevicollis TaxID=3066284 RepID=UPI00313C74A9
MWFKFAKLFLIINTSVQAPTSLIVSNDPNVVNYDITDDMVKHVKYHSFDDWATIPWNSAYFDIDQPDLKLVSGYFYDYFHPDYQYFLNYVSDVTGVLQKHVDFTSHLIFDDEQLNAFSRIIFNHNLVQTKQDNYIEFGGVVGQQKFNVQLEFEISKPLSFYIQGFMFYFNFHYIGSSFNFSFLDYEGNTKYVFKGLVDSHSYLQDMYNFITMPVRVPNLKYLTITFSINSIIENPQQSVSVRFGQINIFSSENITPVPPNSPFNPEYERVSWYDVFGHLRNAFRWVLFGVVGKLLPVEPLREFFAKIDGLLRHIFDDTISSVLNVDFTSGLEQVLTLWVFLKSVGFLIG